MINPYAAPEVNDQNGSAEAIVRGPATALIVVSLIAIFCGVLAIAFDVILIVMGMLEVFDTASSEIFIRTVWGVGLLIASSFVLYGGIQMKAMKKYGIAKAAAVVAMIPLLGPCCLLGIPFGIWAIVALSKPGVREAFEASESL